MGDISYKLVRQIGQEKLNRFLFRYKINLLTYNKMLYVVFVKNIRAASHTFLVEYPFSACRYVLKYRVSNERR